MIKKEEYMQYVEKTLKEDNNKPEMKYLTKGYKILSILMIVFGIIGAFISFVLLPQSNLIGYGFRLFFARETLCVLLIVFGVKRVGNSKKALNYYRDYREKFIGYLMTGYSYYFESNGWLGSFEFEKSQFAKKADCFYSNDVLAIDIPEEDGSKPRADIYIGDVNTYDVSIDSEGNKTTHDVYRGMFGYAEFPYKFKCVLAINTKYSKKNVKLEKVMLEDMEFNENFSVKSNNQIEARYILTPDMMEKLKYLQNKIKNIKILIVDNYCFIGAKNLNMFELKSFKDNNEIEVFENLYDEIYIILKIVEEMKDNDKVFVTKKKTRQRKSKNNELEQADNVEEISQE